MSWQRIFVPVIADFLNGFPHLESLWIVIAPGRLEHQRHLGSDGCPHRGAGFHIEGDRVGRGCETWSARRMKPVSLPALIALVNILLRVRLGGPVKAGREG